MRALFEKDTPTAQCQPWCQPVDDHIRWCKCSGCEFAQSGMKIGDTCSIDPDLKCKPVDDNDLPFESCSTWCSERYLDSHCSMCACKRCGFPAARRPRRQGSRRRTSLLCRRKGCDEAAAPKVGRRELEEGDGDHDPDPGGEPGAEASARRLRCVASRRSALDL